MMRRIQLYFAVSLFLIMSAVSFVNAASDTQTAPPVAAQGADAAAAAPQQQEQECPAAGKCCGSATCAEAKRRSMVEGKAAMGDCPCKRLKKPDHAH
jgi:hypothetical protein